MSAAWIRAGGVCRCVVGAAVMLAIGPVAGMVLVLLWLWRCLALLMVMLIHRRRARAASGMEALFTLDSEGARSIISAVVVLRGQVGVSKVKKLLSERVLEARDARGHYAHPKFRRVVEKRCGIVVWMQEEIFDVSGHVRELQEAGQPRVLVDEAEMVEMVGNRSNLPFVRGHARWEVLVAPLTSYQGGDLAGGYTAIMMRLHHCLGDGRSMVGVLVTALAEPPLPSALAQHHRGSYLDHAARLMWSLSNLPWVMVRVLRRGDHSVLHGPRLGGHKVLAWSAPLPLPALKAGRSLAGVSVNDLLLTGLAQALHRYLEEEEDGEAPTRVMTVLPVDVTTPWDPLSLGNRISLCTLPLPTERMSPLTRLTRVHNLLSELKSSPDVLVNYLTLDLVSNLMPAPIARRALNTHGVTIVASNLPGPPETIHLFGEAVEELMFWIPNKSRTGLAVSMLSYRGQVRMGINVDTALVPTQAQAQHLIDHAAASTAQILLDAMKQKQEQQQQEGQDLTMGNYTVPQIVAHTPDDNDYNSQEATITCIPLPGSRVDEDLAVSEDQILLCHGELEVTADGYHWAHSDTNLHKGHLGHGQGCFALSDINLPPTCK